MLVTFLCCINFSVFFFSRSHKNIPYPDLEIAFMVETGRKKNLSYSAHRPALGSPKNLRLLSKIWVSKCLYDDQHI